MGLLMVMVSAALFVFIEVVQVLEFFIPEFIEFIVIVSRRRGFRSDNDSHHVIREFDNLLFDAHGTYLSRGAKRRCAQLANLVDLDARRTKMIPK
jgi:hypothetical protein